MVKLTAVLVRVSTAGPKHHDKKQLGKESVCLILQLEVHHPGKLGQEVKAGPGGRK